MSQKKKNTYQKKQTETPKTKKLTDETSMRDRTMTKGEKLLMKIGLGVILGTVAVILGIVVVSLFGEEESYVDPLESLTHVTANEVTYLTGTYDGVFDYFFGSEDETYMDIEDKIMNSDNEAIYILFYRSSALDEALLEVIQMYEETLINAAFFVLDLDNPANASIFENTSVKNLGINASDDLALVTRYIEEQPDGFFDTTWKDVRQITISIENI